MQEDMQAISSASLEGDRPKTRNWVVRLCDGIIRWTMRVLVAALPLFFLPWTIEVVEINKQLLLLTGAVIAGMAWLGKMLAERKFEYRRSVVNIIVLLYLAVYTVSAVMSESRYTSLVGDFGQEKAGLITTAAFVVLYFVIVNNVKTAIELGRLFTSIMVGGFLTALYALLQGLGLFVLPFEFAKSAGFNGVGTIAALAIYLAFIVTLAGGILMSGHGQSARSRKLALANNVFVAVTAVLSLIVIVSVDYLPVTISLLVASAIMIGFAFVHAKSVKGIGGILLPTAALVISLLLLVFTMPLKLGYPSEVMPSMKASWSIVVQTMRERPFFGSGPGTFIIDYAKHHAKDVNETAFWNTRFDRGSSRFLTMVATTGLLGALSWLLVALFLLFSAAKKLFKTDEETWHLLIGMFAAWFLLLLAKFLYSSTLALEFATWLTMALLVIVHRKDFFSVRFENSPRAAMTLSFVFILGVVVALSGLVVEGQRYAAEIRYAEAIRIDQAGGDLDKVIENLAKAADLNKANDVYVRNLSLALLAKANKEAATPVQLKKNEGETDEAFKTREDQAKSDKVRMVAQLAGNAVNVAKAATDMAPNNIADWSVLASVYQSLIGVTDAADEWAVKSYEKAIELEPANPSLHTELGKVYMYQASVQANKAQQNEKDEAVKKEAEKQRDDLLAKAVDSFNKAIDLKSDYAPARYQLSLALDAQGKLKDAIKKMEEVASLANQDVGVGFQLALMYFRDDRKEEAIKLMDSVVRLSPDFSNARWYLAAMYEAKGDLGSLDLAIKQIEEVKKLNPDNADIQKKLDDLNAKKAAPQQSAAGQQLPQPVEQPVANPNEPGVKKR
ncbi:MAG: tetratricopeptide repeat protein [Patescibacteria group bacterium]|nr:tetratricopeptide repeat protein [Patescibacteria group bacterium]